MAEERTTQEILKEALRVMEALSGDYSLMAEDIAGAVDVPVKELRRMLEVELGITFRGLLNEMRVRRAKELTARGEVGTWKECALKAGFNDARYFARIFKRSEEMTWGEFRTLIEKEKDNDSISQD